MTAPQDTKAFRKAMNEYCAAFRFILTDDLLSAYWKALKDYEVSRVVASFDKTISNEKFPPTPAIVKGHIQILASDVYPVLT
jgi:hypothetical protein